MPQGSSEPMDINEYVIEVEVSGNSELIGKSIMENRLRDLDDLFLVEIVRGSIT